ncbi:chymotrypsin A-like [Pygocentrus nattereri]|uniref:chymotrypsin A-like n=1 Tax=Pygocentrus nattereri TaxID=42514 RepID=UPI0008149D6A|nr:chymotrypsin A-like [Pygocentrus nattereri]
MAVLWVLSCLAFVSTACSKTLLFHLCSMKLKKTSVKVEIFMPGGHSLAHSPFSGCGDPSITLVISSYSRIVNSEEAEPRSWPWQVLLKAVPNPEIYHLESSDPTQGPNQHNTGLHFCGGSLINEWWVVTAAHYSVSSLNMLAFKNISDSTVEITGPLLRGDLHAPQYDSFTINNEILIKLASPVQLNPHVSPEYLAETSDNFSDGMKCVTSGWGWTKHNVSDTPALLQQTILPLLTSDGCRHYWGSQIADKMICDGASGASTCMSDSGGSLVCQKAGAWTLVGMACPGEAAASCVTEFHDWIN